MSKNITKLKNATNFSKVRIEEYSTCYVNYTNDLESVNFIEFLI